MDDGICTFCNNRTNRFASNPDLWPVTFWDGSGEDKPSAHHVGCLNRRLRERDMMLAALQAWNLTELHMVNCRICSAGHPCSKEIVKQCQAATKELQAALQVVESV